MTVKAENNITKDDIKALVNCNNSKLKFMLILLTVTFSAFLIFSLAIGNKINDLSVYILGIIWCVIVYCCVFFIKPRLKYKSFIKKYTETAVINFQLSETAALISIESEKDNFEKHTDYCDMYRIYETAEYFFFYIKSSKSYIMKKSGLIEGTSEDISSMITNENPRIFIRKAK